MKPCFRTMTALGLALALAPALDALDAEDCLFYAPFDGAANALVARGSPLATPEGNLTYMPGVRGQAVVIGNYEGKDCSPVSFETKDNLYAPVGAVAFWAKNIGEPYFFKDGGYQHFFAFSTKEAHLGFRDYISASAFIVSGQGQNLYTAIWVYWEPDVWNHIVFTWTPNEHRLYVNGTLQRTTTENVFPLTECVGRFTLGQKGKSAVAYDDLCVFRRPLSPDEAKALFSLGRGNAVTAAGKLNAIEPKAMEDARAAAPASELVMARTSQAPEMDGVLSEALWKQAARLGGLVDELTGTIMPDGPVISFTYDDKNIYVAGEYPIPEIYRQSPVFFPSGPLKRTVKDKDGAVQNDDHVAVTLLDKDGAPCTFYINAAGTLRDDKAGDAGWESGFSARTRDDDQAWTVELAIPFAALGLEAKDGGALSFNVSQTLRFLKNTRLCWYAGQGGNGYARLVLGGQTPVVRFERAGHPDAGDLKTVLTVVNPTATAAGIEAKASLAGKELGTTTATVSANQSTEITVGTVLTESMTSAMDLVVASGAKTLYRTSVPFSFAPLLEVARYYYPSSRKLTVTINRTAIPWKEMTATVELLPAGKKKVVLSRAVPKVGPYQETVEMEVSKLPYGDYTIRVTLAGEGKTTMKEITFSKQRDPWWKDSTAGLSKKVPPPFEPVKVDGARIKVWGRLYDYDNALFARQLVTQDKSILARPVALVVAAGGKESRLTDGVTTVERASAQEADLTSSADIAGLTISTRTHVEYDGFAWIDLTVTPQGKVSVDALYLEVPLVKELATLMYNNWYDGSNCGTIPPQGYQGGAGINGSWFGWAGGGIQFSEEHSYNWRNSSKCHYEIVRLEDATAYRLKFIDHAVELDQPFTLSFGLQVTPTKPRYGDWRGWWITYNKRPLGTRGIAIWNDRWSIGCNYPALATASNPEYRFKQKLGQLSKEGYVRDAGGTYRTWEQIRELKKSENITSGMYVQGGFTWPYSPDYRYFEEEWRSLPSGRYTPKPGGELDWWEGQVPVCTASSFTDFYLANLKKSVKREDILALYFDCWTSQHCANESHGCGYVDDKGNRLPVFPLRGQREFYKRVYTMMKEHNPESIISFHMSGQPWMALCSFTDLMATGEQYATGLSRRVAAGEQGNYYKILSLDHAQAEFMGHNWGPLTQFLTEFSAAEVGESYPSRDNPFGAKYFRDERLTEIEHVAGIFALHDMILPWAFRVNLMPFVRTRQAMETFGLDERVEYLPYWDNEKYVKLYVGAGDQKDSAFKQVNRGSIYSGEQIVCAIYRKAETKASKGRALFVVMNNTDQDEPFIKLAIDYGALGFRPEVEARMDDALTGAMYGYQGKEDTVIFPLKARSFRMLTTYAY